MTRRIQRSNLYDRKRSNPAAALSQTHFASDRFQNSRTKHLLAEWTSVVLSCFRVPTNVCFALAALVERHSRFVMLVKVANKDTESVVSALIKQSQRLPSELYRSLTWDRGKELAAHQRLIGHRGRGLLL